MSPRKSSNEKKAQKARARSPSSASETASDPTHDALGDSSPNPSGDMKQEHVAWPVDSSQAYLSWKQRREDEYSAGACRQRQDRISTRGGGSSEEQHSTVLPSQASGSHQPEHFTAAPPPAVAPQQYVPVQPHHQHYTPPQDHTFVLHQLQPSSLRHFQQNVLPQLQNVTVRQPRQPTFGPLPTKTTRSRRFSRQRSAERYPVEFMAAGYSTAGSALPVLGGDVTVMGTDQEWVVQLYNRVGALEREVAALRRRVDCLFHLG